MRGCLGGFPEQLRLNYGNRRSGESRNPGNPPEKSESVTERSGFRLSPERRFYETGLTGLWYDCPGRLSRPALLFCQ